jgi:hypothetical protein
MQTCQIRWLERKTGKTLLNEHGFYYDETVRVLQYRSRQEITDYGTLRPSTGDFSVINTWSEWLDVPVVEE